MDLTQPVNESKPSTVVNCGGGKGSLPYPTVLSSGGMGSQRLTQAEEIKGSFLKQRLSQVEERMGQH